ncbi:hypothetical protein CR513_01996, partial [Mucuna pruriens]
MVGVILIGLVCVFGRVVYLSVNHYAHRIELNELNQSCRLYSQSCSLTENEYRAIILFTYEVKWMKNILSSFD